MDAIPALNVTAPREDPDHVKLELELDNTALEQPPPHAARVRLSSARARELAAELGGYAGRVEEGTG